MEKLTLSLDELSPSLENLINDGATVPVCVSGSSMNPLLVSRRDTVWLRKYSECELKRGKIILFKRKDGRLVLHRIKSVLSDEVLKVNGDAQTWCELVEKQDVVAVVSDIERKGKRSSADSLAYKLYAAAWLLLFPFRSVLMRAWYRLGKFKTNA